MSGEHLCVGLRRQPSQLRVRPGFVVVAPPGFEHDPGMKQGAEQRLVQQFVAQAAVEARSLIPDAWEGPARGPPPYARTSSAERLSACQRASRRDPSSVEAETVLAQEVLL